VILAARPSVGKTSLALCMAQNVAVKEKVPVAVFSLEMSRYDLTSRLLCAEANVNSRLVRTGKLSETDWQKIANAMGTLSEGQIYIDDRPTLTALELRARARRLKIKYNIGMVVIDYIQLMYGTGRAENRNQEVSEISRALKALARELNIPVIALSQLNRASEQRGDHRPQLSDLRESGALEQDSDVVMFIYREGLHNDEVNRNKAELIVAKHRNGPIGEVPLLFLEDQTKFVNTTRQSPQGPQGPQG
jgi:replicative DNA helicase